MDKSLLLFRGGIRSAEKTLGDGQVHTLHFKAKTPNELAVFLGASGRIENTEAGDLGRQRMRAEFIASALCNEDGTPLLTVDEAILIPATLKPELCAMIIEGSNSIGEAGKGLRPEGMIGSGTSSPSPSAAAPSKSGGPR
jgi:hypothetical protein